MDLETTDDERKQRRAESQRKRREAMAALRDASGIVPARQAFAMLRMSEPIGYRAIHTGELRALRRGNRFVVTQEEIARQLSLA